jgi:hypothetical protein
LVVEKRAACGRRATNSSTKSGAAIKVVQQLLLVAGATALGTCSFVLALFCYTAATGFLSNPGHSNLGAAGLGFLLFTGSAVLGAIVGLVAAVWWIRKHDSVLWTHRIWSGITLGIVTGVALHFANKRPRVPTLVEMFDTLPAAAVLTVALGMLGGVTAKLTGP